MRQAGAVVSDRIDVGPLRAAFVRSGLTTSEVCNRMGWKNPDGSPDTTRLLRALGLKAHVSRGYRTCAQRINIDRAALIADALNVDPFEVGL